jgi:hypothetical protein
MDLRPELFTTDPECGWIHVRHIREQPKMSLEECNQECPTIFIILTGWNNKHNKNLPFYFKIPYSSHSNYRELEAFVKSIMPRNLIFNVPDREVTKERLNF